MQPHPNLNPLQKFLAMPLRVIYFTLRSPTTIFQFHICKSYHLKMHAAERYPEENNLPPKDSLSTATLSRSTSVQNNVQFQNEYFRHQNREFPMESLGSMYLKKPPGKTRLRLWADIVFTIFISSGLFIFNFN